MSIKRSNMSEKNENKTTTSEKVTGFLENNVKVLIVICVVVLLGIVAFACIDSVIGKQGEKTVALVDEISFALTDGSAELDDAALKARRSDAMTKLEPVLSKGGIGGVRANMLAADIAFQNEDFEASMNYWSAVAVKGKKYYTAPLANYNAGVCAENCGKTEEAAEFYKKAAENEDFLMKAHAAFSYGRTLEVLGKTEEAVAAYEKLVADSADDAWANLAKTRLIDMKVSK